MVVAADAVRTLADRSHRTTERLVSDWRWVVVRMRPVQSDTAAMARGAVERAAGRRYGDSVAVGVVSGVAPVPTLVAVVAAHAVVVAADCNSRHTDRQCANAAAAAAADDGALRAAETHRVAAAQRSVRAWPPGRSE